MPLDTEPLQKRLWLANGFLLFATLIVILGLVAYAFLWEDLFGDRRTTVRAEPGTSRDGAVPTRAVRFSEPRSNPGTEVQLIAVHHGRGELHQTVGLDGSSGYFSGSNDGPMVNVLFLDPVTSAARLLLDRRAFIVAIDAPYRDADSVRRAISYRIVFADTDRDGELSADDDSELWVTDLEGRNLRRASPEGAIVRSDTFVDDGKRILIFAVDRPPADGEVRDEQMPQRAFVYDVAAGTSAPLTQLDSLALVAGRVVAGR